MKTYRGVDLKKAKFISPDKNVVKRRRTKTGRKKNNENFSSTLLEELSSQAISSSQVESEVSSSQVEPEISQECLEILHEVVDDDDRKDKNEVDDDEEREEEKNEVDDDEEREEKNEVEEKEEKKKKLRKKKEKKNKMRKIEEKIKKLRKKKKKMMKLRMMGTKLSMHTLSLCISSLMLLENGLEDSFRNSCFDQYLDLLMNNNVHFQMTIVY
ncbi:hypothetical protein H5410_002844 [Solanum commersonii]|uniref:Uncharacterized protein n=1 Tax=Solanum commersonii TaxID=4109 RepID=A0A9J6B406_SOLCO|nr:hypothetical protein H5410_002844 [Solanum commersonii]